MSGRESRKAMNETQAQTEATPFWRFSLSFYRQSGVADACIALQDDCGVDVNLLLFLLWLAGDGRRLSADDVKKLDDRVRSWRDLTIIPIRDARRKLKGAATFIDPGKQEAFRTKVKAIELDAERLQQEALYKVTLSGPFGSSAPPRAAARSNIAAYEKAVGSTFTQNAVDVLLGKFDGIDHGSFAS
jgi:uncharacterized protein (TIGR02444 family)